jgi:hypothetical protein
MYQKMTRMFKEKMTMMFMKNDQDVKKENSQKKMPRMLNK